MSEPPTLVKLEETLQLIEKTRTAESPSQKVEFLKKTADQILPYIKQWKPIYLRLESGFEEETITGPPPYRRPIETIIKEYVKESGKHADKGILLYEQPIANRKIGEICEIWLLRSGRLLLIETLSCEYNAGYWGGYKDETHYPNTYKWSGKATKTVDPDELVSRSDEIVKGFVQIIKDILFTIKEVEEGQQKTLFYILETLLSENITIDRFLEQLSSKSTSTIGKYLFEGNVFNTLSRSLLLSLISAGVLAKVGKNVITPLIKKFNEAGEKDSELCLEIINVLLKIDDGDDTTEFLIKAVEEGIGYRWGNSVIARNVAAKLGEIGDERAYLPLLKSLKGLSLIKDDDLRFKAIRSTEEALLKVASKLTAKSIEPLIQALNDTDYKTRLWAVVGLGEIGDEKATEHLIKILDDETWGIRDNAVVALMKIGGEKVLNVVIQTLIETLDEPFDFRCKQAIIKLGEIGDERAAEPLIKILNENTKVELRIEAAKALGRIGSEKAIGALVQVYKKDRDKQLQSVAKEILDRLGKRPKSRFEKMFGR